MAAKGGVGFRLIDAEGREVFEQLKSDLRQG